jgi:hypothetical protein
MRDVFAQAPAKEKSMRYLTACLMAVVTGSALAAGTERPELDPAFTTSHTHAIPIIALVFVLLLMIFIAFRERIAAPFLNLWHLLVSAGGPRHGGARRHPPRPRHPN